MPPKSPHTPEQLLFLNQEAKDWWETLSDDEKRKVKAVWDIAQSAIKHGHSISFTQESVS